MSNSSLICYTKISPHRISPRAATIKKITIHHMAGNLTIETCGNVFSGTRRASANYGIGSDGRIAMYVEEKDRAYTSSSSDNDNQAVTIEVANDGGASTNWHVSDKALESLINLCVDICKRNNIEKLNFTGNKQGNLTMHSYFAATACPGPYLKSKFPWIAEEVNKRLGATENKPVVQAPAKTIYRIRKSWSNAKSQVGAYADLDNAKKACDKAGRGYYVFDEAGNAIYPVVTTSTEFNVGDVIKLATGAKYTNGKSIPNWVIKSKLYVRQIQGDNIVFSTLKVGAITGVVNKDYIVKAEQEPKKSVTEIAKEVIAGKWGNGSTRVEKLKAAGYDPDEVQKKVNELL